MGQDRIDCATLDAPDHLLAPEASVMVNAAVRSPETPAEDERGDRFLGDIAVHRTSKRDRDGSVTTIRASSDRANADTFDGLERLAICEVNVQGLESGRQIVRTNMETGAVEVLTDCFDDKRLHGPNDVVIDPMGCVRFADPSCRPRLEDPGAARRGRSRDRPGWPGDPGAPSAGDRAAERFGSWSNSAVGEGMGLDPQGALEITSGAARPGHDVKTDTMPRGVFVLGPDGGPIGCIAIREDFVTKLAPGGQARKMLSLTAGRTILPSAPAVPGHALRPDRERVGVQRRAT